MPTYTYECRECEEQITVLLKLAEHDTYRPFHCSVPMFQVMFAPQITRDIEPYRSMITGERVAGRSQHREHLRRHGCVEIGNETPKTRKPTIKETRRKILREQLADKNDREVQALVKQEIKNRHV